MTEASRNEGSVWQGLLLCWGINFVLAFTGCSVAWMEAERPGGSNALVNAAIAMTVSTGLLQLLYVVPVCRAMNKNGKNPYPERCNNRSLDYGPPECRMADAQSRAIAPDNYLPLAVWHSRPRQMLELL